VIEQRLLQNEETAMPAAKKQPTDDHIELHAELVIRVRKRDIDAMLDLLRSARDTPILNRAEQRVLCMLFEHDKLTGPQLAEETGYKYGPYLRGMLAGLKRRNLIDNRSGYQLTTLGRDLCSDICQDLADRESPEAGLG
jgi:hypothetical protein